MSSPADSRRNAENGNEIRGLTRAEMLQDIANDKLCPQLWRSYGTSPLVMQSGDSWRSAGTGDGC